MGQAGCAAMTSTTVLSTLLNLKALNAAALSNSAVAQMDDYKAIVCITLEGGNDAFNMLIPTSTGEYQDYSDVRSNIAVAQNQIVPINPLNTPGRTFGVHPSMANIASMFNSGQAAFVANVGTLVEPISVQEFWDQTKRAPLGLLSHSDQLQQWMTALPNERAGIGWGGKIADMINQMNDNPDLSMNISMGGTNIFQTGAQSIEYSMNPVAFFDESGNPQSAIQDIYDYHTDWEFPRIKKNAIDSLLNQTYSDIYKDTYNNTNVRSRDGMLAYKAALDNVTLQTEFNVQIDDYDNQRLTYGLGWVAKMIAARMELGFKRQTFFINFSGFDHHDEIINAQADKLTELDYALNQFQAAMTELGTTDDVVTFLVSDFARTLRSNGNGTDHAWGSNMLTVGGPVLGQRIYGNYPTTLNPNENDFDLGGGIIVPTTSADVYFAQIAEWFGVSVSDLGTIFPNLGNFYDYTNEANPLNFLTV